MKKKTVSIFMLRLFVAGSFMGALWGCGKKMNVSYDMTKVEKGSISNSVTATGTVEPVTQVEVGTQIGRAHV